jgi:tetratricopeptide (TPR) repeat protein
MNAAGVTTILLALLCGGGASLSAQRELSYRDIVARYQAGEYETAVTAITALGLSKLDDERRALGRTLFGSLRADEIRAAIMLHTEAHFHSASGDLANLPAPHLARARVLVQRCLDLLGIPPTETLDDVRQEARAILQATHAREFIRLWYLLLVSHFQGKRHVNRSAHHLEEARALFPDDPDVLLASGSHHEMLTFVGHNRVPTFNERGEWIRDDVIDQGKERTEAARYYRAALGADPALYEAQVRLGRTLYLLGDLALAAKELDAVRTRTNNLTLKCLAAMFLALVEEDGGGRARAAELYVEAMKLFPAAQAPFVGISELLYVDGQPAKAAATMTTLLERPAPRDPWWSYIMSEWWHYDARLKAMRDRVRQ